MTQSKKYLVLRGVQKGNRRYEAGEVVTSNQLKGWGIAALIKKGAIEPKEASSGNR